MLELIGIIIMVALMASIKSEGDTLSKADIVKLILILLIGIFTGGLWIILIFGLISFVMYKFMKRFFK